MGLNRGLRREFLDDLVDDADNDDSGEDRRDNRQNRADGAKRVRRDAGSQRSKTSGNSLHDSPLP